MSEGIDVGALASFPVGEGRRIYGDTIGIDYDIAICNDEGELYAVDDTCTHSLASLSEGWIEECRVECPLHSAEFDLKTGEALSLPAVKPVRTYRVEVVDGRVLLFPGQPRPQ
ncbi:MAG: bifunctional 3-phenylpropionate/cinnamic acid dioxygenase ferredoxin subunit [Actinomycetales bacterium]